MRSPTKLEWVRPPRQQRSAETLERLLDAAEAIIAEQGVDNASVAEIARRAGSSIGAFYARFHDKEGLLRTLFERFGEQADATAVAALDPSRWRGVALGEALTAVLRFTISILHERRRLVAAMLARMPTDPLLAEIGDRLLDGMSALMLALVREKAPGARADLAKAVEFAVWLALSSLELRAVYSLQRQPKHSDEETAAQLCTLCLRYLGVEEPMEVRSPRSRSRSRS